MKICKILLALALALCVTLAMVACMGEDTKDTEGDIRDTETGDTVDTDATGTDTDIDATDTDTDAPDTESDTEQDSQNGPLFENVDTSTGFGPLTPAN